MNWAKILVVVLLAPTLTSLSVPQAHAADTCTSTGKFKIEAKSNPIFYIDSPKITSNYVAYKITNLTADTSTVYSAELTNFSISSNLSIAQYEVASHSLFRSLEINDSVTAFWYLTASSAQASSSSFDVVIKDNIGNEVCRTTQTIGAIKETIKANANKLTSVVYQFPLPAYSTDGSSTFTATVKGQTGTIGAGPYGDKDVNLSPATDDAFDAKRFRLSGSSYRCGATTPVVDVLYIKNACAGSYTAVFTFQHLGSASTGSPTDKLSPIMQISSGANMKHTAPPTFTVAAIGTAPANQVTTNSATNISSTSARLNGTNDYGTYSSIYFVG